MDFNMPGNNVQQGASLPKKKPSYPPWTGAEISWNGPRETTFFNDGASVAVSSTGRESDKQQDAHAIIDVTATTPWNLSFTFEPGTTGVICLQSGDSLRTYFIGSEDETKTIPSAYLLDAQTGTFLTAENGKDYSYKDGDVLTLCSKGLTAQVKEDTIFHLIWANFTNSLAAVARALETRVAAAGAQYNTTIQTTRLKKPAPGTVRVFVVFDGNTPDNAQKNINMLVGELEKLGNVTIQQPQAKDIFILIDKIHMTIEAIKKSYPHADVNLLQQVADGVKDCHKMDAPTLSKYLQLLNRVEQDYGALGKTLKYLVLTVFIIAVVATIVMSSWTPLGIIGALDVGSKVLIGLATLMVAALATVHYSDKKSTLTRSFENNLNALNPVKTKAISESTVVDKFHKEKKLP
jgi:hypothetical protein